MKKIIQYQLRISPETFREVIEESIGEKFQDRELIFEDGKYFLGFEVEDTRIRARLNQERDEISFSYFGNSLDVYTKFELMSIKIDGTRLIKNFGLSGRFYRNRILGSIQTEVAKKLQERIILKFKDVEL